MVLPISLCLTFDLTCSKFLHRRHADKTNSSFMTRSIKTIWDNIRGNRIIFTISPISCMELWVKTVSRRQHFYIDIRALVDL